MQSSNRTDFIKLCHVCVFTCVYVCTYMAAVGQHPVLLLSPILSFAAEPRAHQVASKVQGSPWFWVHTAMLSLLPWVLTIWTQILKLAMGTS